MHPLPRFAGVAIFVLALAALCLEITLTRVFSVMTVHHSVYLIIGLALLGFGAAGAVLTVNPRFHGPGVRGELLADCIWLFGVAIMASFLAITKTIFDAEAIYTHRDPSQLFGMLLLLVYTAVPFFFAGLCIGYLVSKSGDEINRIYFADLLGAGCGALGAVFGINYLGATSTVFWIALAVCVVAMLVGGRAGGRVRWRYPLTAVIAAALAVGTTLRDALVPVPVPASKIPDYHATDYRWNVINRVDIVGPEGGYPNFSGSLSRVYDNTQPELTHIKIHQDGQAFTGLVKLQDTAPKDLAILGHYLQGAGYALVPNAKVLVIGPGGGIDVAIALHHGAAHVTAVEINPATVEYVRDRYNDFAGGLYRRPDVEVVVAEGRHYLTATDRKFDVIQLSGVDTFTALASGATALTEAYLYTTEALGAFLDHLTDDGVVSFSRWLFTPDRETLRLVVTARAALEARGVADAHAHVAVIAAPAWHNRSPWAETLVKRTPFTRDELARLRAWADKLQFDVLYDPFVPYQPGGEYDQLAGTPQYGPAAAARELSRALRTPSDRLDQYVRDYFYNIRPAPDDAPFFFDYYGFKSLANPFAPSAGGFPVTRLPLALVVMPAAVIQIALLAALCILWPLRTRLSGLAGLPGKFRILLYFAAIGLAFIAVEVMLLQKLMVFLGGPVYSMAVTLFSILVFCGVGAYLSKLFTRGSAKIGGALALVLLAAAIYATTWFLNSQLPLLMHLSHPLRCVAAVAVLLPVGLLMGMPFPTGIRLAEQLNPNLTPWCWSVNAFATVLGSIGCIFVALLSDFTTVLYAGLGVYLIALLALLALPSGRAIAPANAP
ncbi:MAG: hypothetical protein AB7Q17_18630 [Phycisphaerae bacterium]